MKKVDIAVIGGGPAGLAATAYALHAQLDVLLCAPELGGKVGYEFALRGQPPVDTVWGADLVQRFMNDVRSHLGHYTSDTITKVALADDGSFRLARQAGGQDILARTVIVATGAEPQRLYVPGEADYMGRGVSFSAVSHAPLCRDRVVAVVGGGQRARSAALELAHIAKEVFWLPTYTRDAPDKVKDAITHLPNVAVFNGWEVERILGDDFVTGLVLSGGNRAAREVAVDAVFVELGLVRNANLVRAVSSTSTRRRATSASTSGAQPVAPVSMPQATSLTPMPSRCPLPLARASKRPSVPGTT